MDQATQPSRLRSSFVPERRRAIAQAIISRSKNFDPDLVTGPQIATRLGDCHFVSGFLRNVTYAGLTVASDQPLFATSRDSVGNYGHGLRS
jgi:hypothetical protein